MNSIDIVASLGAPHFRIRPAGRWRVRTLDSCPRAWRRPAGRRRVRRPQWFIPACVGTTAHRRRRSPRRPVHPRVRGDHAFSGHKRWPTVGSSPRAWGPPVPACADMAIGRFIPACVGTTRRQSAATSPAGSSPRAWGPRRRGPSDLWDIGSSPRAWGPLRHLHDDIDVARFIPACVGTTDAGADQWAQGPVHPRVRGGDGVRFIPACAGQCRCRAACAVHPRVRGDHRRQEKAHLAGRAVHPRVRGDHSRFSTVLHS